MNSHDESDNYIYEKLYDAIMKAITSSEDVKETLQDLHAADRIDNMAVMNVILSLKELSDLIESGATPKNREPEDAPSKELEKSHEKNFNEAQWLKKNGIRF